MSARDLARFALLYLHDGRWNGRQIVPGAWVHDSTQSYSDAFPDQGRGYGYGYLWWIGFPDNNGAPTVKVPPGTFAAMGAEGQYAFVIPALDLVIVHRINSDVPVGPLPGQRKPAPTTPQLARLLGSFWRRRATTTLGLISVWLTRPAIVSPVKKSRRSLPAQPFRSARC